MDKAEILTYVRRLKDERSLPEFYKEKEKMIALITELAGLTNMDGELAKKIIARRDVLNKMKMEELREIGRPLGAKDSKKSELIEEILEEEVSRGMLN